MTILITDDFVGPAGVLSGTATDQGDNWSADLTDLVQTGEGGLAVDTAAMSFTRWGTVENTAARDMRVQISFSRYTLTNVGAMVGVFARNTAGNTTDFVDASVVFGDGTCKVYLQATGGSQAPFVQYTRLAGDLDASNHTLALEVEGPAIRVYLDGLLVINTTATTVPAASPWFCGVMMNNDAIGGTPRVDSFSATQIVPVVSALRKAVFDVSLLRQGWFAATRRPKGWFTNELMDEAVSGGATGAIAGATSATTLSTPAGTQAQAGAIAAASTATTAGTAAGTQRHTGVIAPATTATSTSTPAGTQAQQGAIAPATSATSMSTAAATEVHAGVIAPASAATSTTGPAGSQAQAGAISPASSATTSTGPAATQVQQGAIAGATSATSMSTVAGDAGNAATPGVIAPASVATSLSTPAGTQQQVGAIASATSSTSMGTVAGTQEQVGAPAPATSATQLSTIAVGDAPAPPPAPPDTGSGGGGGASPQSGRIPFHLRVNMLGRKPDVPLHVASEDWEGEMFALAQALITSGVLEECP
jgi:hypothetical protein